MLESAVLRKVRRRIVPLLGLSYLVALIDRNNLAFASVSMNADLHFSQTVYGLGVAAFFVGYSLFEVPSNLMLDRFGARRWLARIMFTWGLVSMAMALVHLPWQFYLLRFLLGVAEAGFYPGVAHYLADWMPARRRGSAISLFYIASPIGLIVTSGLAVPLLSLGGFARLSGWQWLFLIEGLPALAMAWLLLVRLPDAPRTANWLASHEKDWLLDELARDAATSGPQRHGLLPALSDPFVLLAGLATAFNFGVGAAVLYSGPKLMITRMHGTMDDAARISIVMGLVTVPAMLAAGRLADRMANPFLLKAGLLTTAALGLAAMRIGGTDPLLTYGGLILFYATSQTAGMLLSVLVSRFVHPSGRAAGLAMANSIAQVGAFVGPAMWGAAADATGGFDAGVTVTIPVMLAAALLVLMAGQVRRPAPQLQPA